VLRGAVHIVFFFKVSCKLFRKERDPVDEDLPGAYLLLLWLTSCVQAIDFFACSLVKYVFRDFFAKELNQATKPGKKYGIQQDL
jgi:hypothetical protein